jgi:hypothetical protein
MAQNPDEIIRLTVAPAAEASPALKYHLLPPLRDQSPGNAVVHYYRAYSPDWLTHRRQAGFDEKINKWLEMPPKELPRDELKWVLTYGPLDEIKLGSRREQCDWELTARIRKEGPHLRLPDIQGFRDMANLLRLRARLHMAAGNYDEAVATLQTGFALGRHVGEVPNLLCSVVGMAMTESMTKEVETLIQLPAGPNLYWALTELPRPFIDLRKPLQGEQLMVQSVLPSVHDLDWAPLSSPQMQEQIHRLLGTVRELGEDLIPAQKAEAQLLFTGLVAKYYPQAKRYLVGHGRKPELIDAMPAPQVVMIYALIHFQQLQEELFRWAAVPYPQARAGLRRANEHRQKVCEGLEEGIPLVTAFITAFDSIFRAQVQTDRRIAAVRCIEAIRLYAAAHDGPLPRQLSDITEVPVPLDPATGQAFEYRAEGNKATLIARPPAGDYSPPLLHYELTLKR